MILIAKSVSKWYPEIFLILLVIMYWVSLGTLISPVAIVLITLLLAQLTYKNKFLGLIISTLFLMGSLYLCFVLFWDIFNAESFYPSGFKLMILGVLFLGFTSYFSVILLFKNLNKANDRFPIGQD
ncbi:hypothetical protein [Patiriisocius sp. Uisw_017]|jgi:hypothetical protein|uniref:hypothetical protein n=1 Tax=Patiriisocius sp. Uisw_017 TaxID=3230968 RepID=UPI0039E79561